MWNGKPKLLVIWSSLTWLRVSDLDSKIESLHYVIRSLSFFSIIIMIIEAYMVGKPLIFCINFAPLVSLASSPGAQGLQDPPRCGCQFFHGTTATWYPQSMELYVILRLDQQSRFEWIEIINNKWYTGKLNALGIIFIKTSYRKTIHNTYVWIMMIH